VLTKADRYFGNSAGNFKVEEEERIFQSSSFETNPTQP
jgi:hypothetical protein